MKNKQIIDSWNKIKPDTAADARMLDAILTYNQSDHSDKKIHSRKFNRKWFIAISACLLLFIAFTAIINNGRLISKVYKSYINGGTLSFYKSEEPMGLGSIDFGRSAGRDLTLEENGILFGDLGVTSNGVFDSTDSTLIYLEGRTGNTKVILATLDYIPADWITNGWEKTSDINGIQVSAGYFITRPNSQNVRNIIYCASFNLNDVHIYVECGGNLKASNTWKSEITYVIDRLIQNGTPNLSAISGY